MVSQKKQSLQTILTKVAPYSNHHPCPTISQCSCKIQSLKDTRWKWHSTMQGRSNEFESGEATSGNLFVFHGSENCHPLSL